MFYISSKMRLIGQVKFFNKERGFGFITNLDAIPDVDGNKEDIFAHFSAIKPTKSCWSVLYPGEYVEFSIIEGSAGKQADNITGIRGGILRCEYEFDNREKRVVKKK